jgi:molybdate transport system regulatory protein
MTAKAKPANTLSFNLRLQIGAKGNFMLGPGKVALLTLINETGSLGEAAKRMEMSYMKAWSLVQTMKPLVALKRGGKSGGGAALTPLGQKALVLYRKMESDSRRACKNSWKKLQLLLIDQAQRNEVVGSKK